MKSIVKLSSISKSFCEQDNKKVILDNVDLEILSGKVIALLGPSGSGKTTLLNILGLLERPDDGEVFIDGKNANDFSEKDKLEFRRAYVGFIYQFHYLLEEFSVYENLYIAQQITGRTDKDYILKLLVELGIEDKKDAYPSKMSGGEKQRIAIARALVNKPKLVIADEATGNLDQENARNVFEKFKKLAKETGVAIVMATHDESFCDYADATYRMSEGKLINS